MRVGKVTGAIIGMNEMDRLGESWPGREAAGCRAGTAPGDGTEKIQAGVFGHVKFKSGWLA